MHNNEYFEWLCRIVTGDYSFKSDHRKLLWKLFEVEFSWVIENDVSRAMDGLDLRDHFERYEHGYCDIDGRCRMLEMMIALAQRMENLMQDISYGDRTAQWFWEMISSLGLGDCTDRNFDERAVDRIIRCFLLRRYNKNGKGGLFIIPNCNCDVATVEIWYQMHWYLDTIA